MVRVSADQIPKFPLTVRLITDYLEKLKPQIKAQLVEPIPKSNRYPINTTRQQCQTS